MHPHQSDTVLDRREYQARHCQHRLDRHGRQKVRRLFGLPMGLVLLCVLTLSGCNSGGGSVAGAQQIGDIQDKRIETFLINVDSFVLETDAPPNVEVRDSANVYVMQSDGDVTFLPLNGAAGGVIKIGLEFDDVVIERPDVGVMTVMRDQ